MDNDLLSREGTQDLVARLRASQAHAKSPTWCDVHAQNAQAAVDLLTAYTDRHARANALDLIAKLKAGLAGVPYYDWCRVEAVTLQAAGDLLETYLNEAGPLKR